MRTLIVSEHLSLDGVIQGPGSTQEDTSEGFKLGGWSAPYDDDVIGQFVQEQMSQPFELLLGRRTYDIWAPYWPHVPKDSSGYAIAEVFNKVPKHVATHRPDSLSWQNSRALKGNLAEAVRTLKQKDGANLLSWGSSQLVQQLLSAGLVDELHLIIYPVVLGHGKRLFNDKAQASSFHLTQSATGSTGVLITRYVRSGDVRTGDIGG